MAAAIQGIAEALGLRQPGKTPITQFGLISAIETGLSVRSLDRVCAVILQSIGANLIDDSDTPTFLLLVDNHSAPLAGDHFHCRA